jgi:hypothetical protein
MEVVDLCDKLMSINPFERLGAGEEGTEYDYQALKNHKLFEGLNFDKIKEGKVMPPIPRDLIENMEKM